MPAESIPFGGRLENAVVSYGAYLVKTAWPAKLAVFYPHPWSVHAAVPAWQVAVAALLLAAATAAALLQAGRRPYLPVGWLWYLGTLVPVIGLVQVGSQAMADRYTYVPLTGIFLAVAWGVPEALRAWRFRRTALALAGAAALLALAAAARVQAGLWKSSTTLFRHALAVTSGNWMIHSNLGFALEKEGLRAEAVSHYREALRIRPECAEAHNNLGVYLWEMGAREEAIRHFREALRHKPGLASARRNLEIAGASATR